MIIIVSAILVAALATASFLISRGIERTYPPIGEFLTVNGRQMHFVDTGPVEDNSKPAIVFIHGAGGNLRDAVSIYRERLGKDFRVIFPDRPGHGHSHGFVGSNDPDKQANAIADLLNELDVEKAIVVGHSYGGLITGVMGVLRPENLAGLVFVAPVSHPWGTGVSWQYDLGGMPVIGWVFSRLVVPVAGLFMYKGAVRNVFSPNTPPADYEQTSGTKLVLRPANFRANALDVTRVSDFVDRFHPRYKEITLPSTILHGDKDHVTSAEIHSINGLAKDIEGAELVILEEIGHMPDHFVAAKIEAHIRQIAERITTQQARQKTAQQQ